MSELTRDVLGVSGPIWEDPHGRSPEAWMAARADLADAAVILARQVEDLEGVIEDLGDLLDDASTWGPADEERMLPKLHALRHRLHSAIHPHNP